MFDLDGTSTKKISIPHFSAEDRFLRNSFLAKSRFLKHLAHRKRQSYTVSYKGLVQQNNMLLFLQTPKIETPGGMPMCGIAAKPVPEKTKILKIGTRSDISRPCMKNTVYIRNNCPVLKSKLGSKPIDFLLIIVLTFFCVLFLAMIFNRRFS